MKGSGEVEVERERGNWTDLVLSGESEECLAVEGDALNVVPVGGRRECLQQLEPSSVEGIHLPFKQQSQAGTLRVQTPSILMLMGSLGCV
jgi:hypothetical protein